MNHKIELEIIVISSVWLQIKSPVKSDEEQNSVMDLMVENELWNLNIGDFDPRI